MLPGERLWSARQTCAYLAELRGRKYMHPYTLKKAIETQGLPCIPDPFDPDHNAFFKSEIDEWLAGLSAKAKAAEKAPVAPKAPAKRRGRPRKYNNAPAGTRGGNRG